MAQHLNKFMSFRACVYPSEEKGYFVAHCLELDIFGEGRSVEEAISELLEVIETQFESCQDTGAQFQFFAPSAVWHKYQSGKKANRTIAGELLDRIIRDANRRLGHISLDMFDNVVGTKEVPAECLATT
jgi:predicted RNase H-like HicB family nuclease